MDQDNRRNLLKVVPMRLREHLGTSTSRDVCMGRGKEEVWRGSILCYSAVWSCCPGSEKVPLVL